MEDIKEQIRKRIEMLHNRINELMEQQKATDKQIRAYKSLVRHYHAVLETEHGLGMEGELSPEIIERLERIIGEVESNKRKQYKSIPDAVLEILSERDKTMGATEIANAIVEKYPEIDQQVKNIPKRVTVALVRGVQQGIYDRLGRNMYRLKTK